MCPPDTQRDHVSEMALKHLPSDSALEDMTERVPTPAIRFYLSFHGGIESFERMLAIGSAIEAATEPL